MKTHTGRYGSSPRVRGTVHDDLSALDIRKCQRFIPACAGNRRYTSEDRPLVASGGSSPRVRGTALQFPDIRGHQRFIPACAGNSRQTTSPLYTTTVHPRVCGEQF